MKPIASLTGFLQKISIRSKLILIIAAVIGLIAAFLFLYYPVRLKGKSVASLVDKNQTSARLLAYSLSPALYNRDTNTAEEIVLAARMNSDLLYLVVTDDSQKVFTSYNLAQAHQLSFKEKSTQAELDFNLSVYQFAVPLIFDGESIGKLYLGISLTQLQKEVALIRWDGVLLSLTIFVVGVLLVIVVASLITEPLSQIVKTVNSISSTDLKQRVTVSGSDEIALLASAFNAMLEKLEKAYAELDGFNKDLEIKVESRTAALSLANAQLQSELKARQKAEKDLAGEKELVMITLSAIDDGVITTDINGKVLLLNKSAEALTGWAEVDVHGQSIERVFSLQDAEPSNRTIARILKNQGPSVSLEKATLVNKHDQKRAIIYTISNIKDSYGEIIGTVLIFRPAA